MIPFNLLLRPAAIIRSHPVREWRNVTLWLKWGLIIALGTILLRLMNASDPGSLSYLFSLIEFLESQNEAITLPLPMKMGLFFILETLFLLVAWLLKSGVLILCYQFLDAPFLEPEIALSITGASLITGVWWILPLVGPYLMHLHAVILIAYLLSQIHRLGPFQSLFLALIPGLIPLVL